MQSPIPQSCQQALHTSGSKKLPPLPLTTLPRAEALSEAQEALSKDMDIDVFITLMPSNTPVSHQVRRRPHDKPCWVTLSPLMPVLGGAGWPFPSASLALGGAPWPARPHKDYLTITIHLLSEAALPLQNSGTEAQLDLAQRKPR